MLKTGKKSLQLKILVFVFCGVIVANISMLTYYFKVTSLAYFNSDAASNLILADEILNSGELISSSWIYNNKDVFIFNYQLIAAALVKFLGLNYNVHVYASAIFAVVLLVLLSAAVRGLSRSLIVSLIVAAIFSSGISSPFIAQLLFDWGGAYGSWFILSLVVWVVLLALHRYSKCPSFNNSYVFFLLLAVAVFIGSVSNTSKTLLYIVAPAFILELADIYKSKEKYSILYSALTVILVAVAFTMGGFLNSLADSSESILTNPSVYDQSSLISHLGNVFNGYLYLFGYPTTAAAQPNLLISVAGGVKSFDGLYLFCRAAMAVAFIALPIYYVVELKKWWKINIFLLFPAVSFILALSTHLILFRYPNNTDPGSIRYVFVPLMLMIVSLLSCNRRLLENFALRRPAILIVFALSLVLISYMNYVRPSVLNKNITSGPIELSKCLLDNNVAFGYADFWSASSVTVLSGSKVVVRPVVFSGGKVGKMPFLVSKKWYSPSDNSEFFIVFPNRHLAQEVNGGRLIAKSSRSFACQSNIVYVFDGSQFNLFDNLSFDIKLASSSNPKLVAHESSELIKFNSTSAGYIVYGDYMNLTKGRYKLSYFVKGGNGNSLSCGHVDVVSDLGTKVLGKYDFNKGRTTNLFEVPKDTSTFEFRVYSTGICPLTVSKKIELIRLD